MSIPGKICQYTLERKAIQSWQPNKKSTQETKNVVQSLQSPELETAQKFARKELTSIEEVEATLDAMDAENKAKDAELDQHVTEIGSCTLTHETAALFHWDNLIADDTWGLYDSTFLIPFLTS